MRKSFALFALAGAAAALVFTSVAAEAQSRKKNAPRQLTITKRSFLDNGKYPPIGSMNRYATMYTQHNYLPYYDQRGRYGVETLPGRFGAFSPW